VREQFLPRDDLLAKHKHVRQMKARKDGL